MGTSEDALRRYGQATAGSVVFRDYSDDPRERAAVRRAQAPEFMAAMGEAIRGGPEALAKLHSAQAARLRLWNSLALVSIASIALVVWLAWRYSWWLLLLLWISLFLAQQLTIRATAYRKRMEAMELHMGAMTEPE